MTFWDTISDTTQDWFGISFGILGHKSTIVGFFAIIMLGIISSMLMTIGIISMYGKVKTPWLGPFSLGLMGIMGLLWIMIPGFPIMTIIGFFGGIGLLIAAVLTYKGKMDDKYNPMIALIAGIAGTVLAFLAAAIEMYGGGGFLV